MACDTSKVASADDEPKVAFGRSRSLKGIIATSAVNYRGFSASISDVPFKLRQQNKTVHTPPLNHSSLRRFRRHPGSGGRKVVFRNFEVKCLIEN